MSEERLIGYLDDEREEAAVAGAAEVTFGPVPAGELWEIERVTVKTTSVGATQAIFYIGASLRDATNSGNLDTSDVQPPYRVREGQTLRVAWTGMDAGSRATGSIQGKKRVPVGGGSKGRRATKPRRARTAGSW